MDTGSDTVVLSLRYYREIFGKHAKPYNTPAQLRTADGSKLQLIGESFIKFEINGKVYPHECLIVRNLKHNLILGRDWMEKYNCILNFSDNTCSLGRQKLSFTRYNEVKSIIRTTQTITIPPQTLKTVYGKYHTNAPIGPIGSNIQWEQCSECFLKNEPGLMILSGLDKIRKSRKVPLTIVNETGRYFTIKKGNVLVKLSQVQEINSMYSSIPDQQKENNSFAYKHQLLPELPPELPAAEASLVQAVLERNADVFAQSEFDVGKSNILKAHIGTGTAKPIRKRPYRSPMAYRQEIKRQLDEMLEAKIISPSNSNWAAAILCVKKKSGEVRVCVDYRELNKVTDYFEWPLPVIQDVFCTLGGAKYFSSLDFIKGYYQIEMDKESRDKTAFVCEFGQYAFERLAFGLSLAPSIFQENMTKLLNGLNQFSLPYLDDIIVYSHTLEEHLDHLNQVFDRIRKAGMKLKASKCEILKPELNYLGHVITNKGELKMDQNKIKVIQELPPPQNQKQTRSLVGTVGYYRKFIKNFSKIAEPLTQLTRKDAKFHWGTDQQAAFEQLKAALITAPVLHLPEMGKPFVLYTDASDATIGAVLAQDVNGDHKPVYYLSHHLSDTQQRWPIIEKECYSIVFALEKFRPYLEGTRFKIYSDHHP